MPLVKAFFPAGLLTWLVCLFIGKGGSTGGFLNIHRIMIEGYTLYWSWPLFLAATAIAWFVFLTID